MTPAFRQYLGFKKQFPDCLLFFQMGDFYETFDDDARLLASVCDVTLTSREFGRTGRRPLAGVPVRSADGYLAKLVAAGHKVAVVDQVQQSGGPATTLKNAQAAAARAGHGSAPKSDSKLFDRTVARIITPGTVVDPAMLTAKANNFVVAILLDGASCGLAYADVSTGEFACCQIRADALTIELDRLMPAEIVVPRGQEVDSTAARSDREPWQFEIETARDCLLRHFEVGTLEGFGCADSPLAACAAGGLLAYLQETQRGSIGRFSRLVTVSTDRTMALDTPTRRNLELVHGGRSNRRDGTLIAVLDETQTAMGGRQLRRWLMAPLIDREPLEERQAAVAAFHTDSLCRAEVRSILAKIGDLERLIQRVCGGQAGPREVVALRRSIELLPTLTLAMVYAADLGPIAERLDPCAEVAGAVAAALRDEVPASLSDGGVIRPGYSRDLDEMIDAGRDGRAYIANLERQERDRTGIPSLKVGFNKVFGYYLEVSHAHSSRVPADYLRKQTLVGAERYITPEMKEVEARVLNSQEKIVELESRLFRELCREVAACADRIRAAAAAVADLDVFAALAEVALMRGYCRPVIDDGEAIHIRNGRHPVVEATIHDGFVPNDIDLACDDGQVLMLTGPNMAGKSVFVRQVALIVLLAQIGSFVPAESARIGLVDRIFTRVGAQDDQAAGHSTFMVEMAETANILHHATRRSLIILDEIGRGTSTYDGMAIAKAIVEFIHDSPRLGARTLFATHYHELVALESSLPRVRNARMEVLEEGERVVFLHRVVPGGADKSYGVYVARLAGVPRPVVQRAEAILHELETRPAPKPSRRRAPQLSLLPPSSGILEEIAGLDVDALSPLEAITKLYELRSRAGMAFRLVQ